MKLFQLDRGDGFGALVALDHFAYAYAIASGGSYLVTDTDPIKFSDTRSPLQLYDDLLGYGLNLLLVPGEDERDLFLVNADMILGVTHQHTWNADALAWDDRSCLAMPNGVFLTCRWPRENLIKKLQEIS